ncbi:MULTISPECIES: hypothetical protein [unclassified Egicoccus]|uniref:hypothetical protein n=1 Tax=unclassified Egicoccus TaxID=2635606 RepID=UPI00359DDC30
MNPNDIPTDLPPHPEEAKLRRREKELAVTVRRLSKQTQRALEDGSPRSRVDAAVLLAQLANVAATAQKGMVRAIQDQMDAQAGKPYVPFGEREQSDPGSLDEWLDRPRSE